MICARRQHDSIRNNFRFRRGTIVVLTAAMIIAFLATVVLSVDVSYMQLTKVKLRSATDAAARAAGEGLSREQDLAAARQAAKNIAAANRVAGKPLLLDDSDIVFGKSSQQAGGAWTLFREDSQSTPSASSDGARARTLGQRADVFRPRVQRVRLPADPGGHGRAARSRHLPGPGPLQLDEVLSDRPGRRYADQRPAILPAAEHGAEPLGRAVGRGAAIHQCAGSDAAIGVRGAGLVRRRQ